MLVRTTFAAVALLAGLTTVASAQSYPGFGAGYGPVTPFAPFGLFAPAGYGPFSAAYVAVPPAGAPAGPPARAAFAYAPGYGWGGGYGPGWGSYASAWGGGFGPWGYGGALWQSPAAAPVAPVRRARAAAARGAYAYQPGPYAAAPYAQPIGTFQALWEAPATPAPRGSRILP